MVRLLLAFSFCLLAGCGKSAPPGFDAHLSDYLREPEQAENAPRTKIKLKLVPVDVLKKRIDSEVYHALPEDLRAAGPDEVGTVVQIRWKETDVTQGRTFYKVEGVFVDPKTNKVIWDFGVQGGASKFRNRSGTKPIELVVDAIKQLVENSQSR
ncbi:MAG: DUF4136 domain-containing protein [Gemmataceae bacterium]|nr:DUF4136 domain-containing protein [Gemmataceae bacterium]